MTARYHSVFRPSLLTGQVIVVTGGADGLFVDDTRLLSRFVLSTGGVLPSRLNSGVPVYALTPEITTRYKLSLFRGVHPLMLQYIEHRRVKKDEPRRLLEREVFSTTITNDCSHNSLNFITRLFLNFCNPFNHGFRKFISRL